MDQHGVVSKHLYYEDFRAGERVEIGAHCFTEEEILKFAREFDPQSFHVDRVAAATSIYGGIIASGWHTCSVLMRLMCDSFLLRTHGMGSPGIDELRWLKPVRPGDTVRGVRTTLSSRVSQSKPDLGLVESLLQGFNQRDELVVSLKSISIMKRRPAGQSK